MSASSSSSNWTPLRHPAFLVLWSGGGVFFLGNAMHTMAVSWLMVEITGSSLLSALVQTAAFLPMFLLSLPAGVLADIADRRRLILASLAVYAVTALLLAVLAVAGHAGPATLLGLTFVMGCCTALQSPSWTSAVMDTIDRDEMPKAITIVSMAFNGARAVGPALAGVIFAVAGSGVVFALAVVTALAMRAAVRRHPPHPHPKSNLPAERLWGGMASGLRYARHSPAVFAQLVRTVWFTGVGSALWALLPVVAQRQLGLGAAGYGTLMGCLGTGAVATGFFLGRLRAHFGIDRMVAGCSAAFALAMVVAALSTSRALVYPALVLGGAGWMAATSTMNAATQTSAPMWVRARAAAMHVLCALGSFAIGSALWGLAAAAFGLTFTLLAGAVAMLAGIVLARPFPLRMGDRDEMAKAPAWGKLAVVDEPAPAAGPVAVEYVYRIRPDDAAAFLQAAAPLRKARRRDGATFWRIYRDLGDPTRYVERFIVASWADYLRQRERTVVADRELEARVHALQAEGVPVGMQHYLAER